jgi:glycosyltransferase involved in cell wall biosynthesis
VGSEPIPGNAHVEFKGTVNDPSLMAEIYSGNDVLVVTSEREGFPMVIMEAMANGLAVVSTPVGDVPNRLDATNTVVTSGIAAETVVGEMEHAIIALDMDRARLQRMKETAIAKAKVEFDVAKFRANYLALLSKPAS